MSTRLDIERCLHALSGNATHKETPGRPKFPDSPSGGRAPSGGLGGERDQDASTRAGRLMRKQMLVSQSTVLEDAANVVLMARLRAAGAFQGQPSKRRSWLPAWFGMPAAAGMLSLAGVATLFVMLRPVEPPLDDGLEVLRGAEQAQHLQVADPAAFAAELQALLQDRHLLVRRVDAANGASIQLQAKLPVDAQQLRQALLARGVQVPGHGRLSLLIERLPAH